MDLETFVTSHLPEPPVRVLEVGCGKGELARALAVRGYAVTAIDPDAPEDVIFRRTTLEEFEEDRPFDAVVTSRSLHHVHDLAAGLNKIYELLRAGGYLIVNEFAWDQMDHRTARWYLSHVDEPGTEHESLRPRNFPRAWIAEHEALHDGPTMQRLLDGLFEAKVFERTPYVAEDYLKRPDLIDEERELIGRGAINPVGFRYVGMRPGA